MSDGWGPRPGDIAWERAEELFPGCSAEWDVYSQRFRGTWKIDAMFENASSGISVMVSADDSGHWGLFVFGPDRLRWERS